MRPDIFQLVVDAFAQRYAGMGVTSVGGFDARGFVIGAPLALALKLPFFMLRKPGKMPNAIRGGAYEVGSYEADRARGGMCLPRGHPLDQEDPRNRSTVVKRGDRVLLVDDLVATGGTLAAGIELVRAAHAIETANSCHTHLRGLHRKGSPPLEPTSRCRRCTPWALPWWSARASSR